MVHQYEIFLPASLDTPPDRLLMPFALVDMIGFPITLDEGSTASCHDALDTGIALASINGKPSRSD